MSRLTAQRAGVVTRGDLEDVRREIFRSLEAGEVQIPSVQSANPNRAGGVNHCQNSDLSYSLMAATTVSVTPGTAGDTNHEAYRFFRQTKGSNLTLDAAHALKAVDHSLYAASEGVDAKIPVWDRVNGWVVLGSTGTQYDIAIQLPTNVVGPGQRWYVRLRVSALDAAILPDDVEIFAGVWHVTGAGEGWVEGGAFNLSYAIGGTVGAAAIEYRVLAKTDSGVSILSNVLSVADAPAVLSTSNYVKLFFNPGPGFIEFEIYKKVGGVYRHIFTIRNSSDLQYNDTGLDTFGVVAGWPAVTQAAPQAYAETRAALVGAFGAEWSPNDLTIAVPSTYDFSQTISQYLRIGLTNPTGVNRHIGIDRIWFSTTYNEWAPDDASKYLSGPSISPTSGNQGSGGGVFDPPDEGTGGATCVALGTPVLTPQGFRRFDAVKVGREVKGEERLPYVVTDKKVGTVSEYYEIVTRNGVRLECSADHPLALCVSPRRRIQARAVREGTKLLTWVKGRKVLSAVVSVRLIPVPREVGTFTLRHSGGLHREGQGMYVAGRSKQKDRGLFCFNLKRELPL